ncbi:hypothetical protein VTO73DRAFT_2792 [Trametes versicolor]
MHVLTATARQSQDVRRSEPTESNLVDYVRVPQHKRTIGGKLAAREPIASYTADTTANSAATHTRLVSHHLAQPLDRTSPSGSRSSLSVPSPPVIPAVATATSTATYPSLKRHRDPDLGHPYKNARPRHAVELENSYPLHRVGGLHDVPRAEYMHPINMGEHAVRGGAPTFASFGANANDTNLDYRHTDPYHADQPASDGIAEEYNQRTLTTAHQVFVRPQIGFHDHSQVVSEPAAIQADASYNIGLLSGDFVGPPASTSAENDVSYSPSFLNNEFYQPVDEGEIALLIQNILQQVEDVLGGKDANTSASQHPTSYPQHLLDAPQPYPYPALVSPSSSPCADFTGSGGMGSLQFPFATPSTPSSFDDFQGAYDQYWYALLDAQRSSPGVLQSQASQHTPLQMQRSDYSEIADPQRWDTHAGLAMEYPRPLKLRHARAASPLPEWHYGGVSVHEPDSSPTDGLSSNIFPPRSNLLRQQAVTWRDSQDVMSTKPISPSELHHFSLHIPEPAPSADVRFL